MRKQYVNPAVLKEEVNRYKRIVEYHYFTDLAEEDENKVDQLTMDDFSNASGGAPPEGGPQPDASVPPEAEGGAAPEAGAPPDDPFAGVGDDGAPENAAPTDSDPAQEVDVTDIVNDTKAVNQKTDEITGKVDKTMSMVNSLMDKISGLEGNISKMGQALSKIDSIYQDFELSKPPTPEETKQALAQNSYPFNVPLDDYGKEGVDKNQTEMEGKKNKLSLSGLLSDFNEREIRNSFNPPDPMEDRVSRSLPAYRM